MCSSDLDRARQSLSDPRVRRRGSFSQRGGDRTEEDAGPEEDPNGGQTSLDEF